MFRRHYEKRSTNIVFVIFRLILSVTMFAILVIGIYSAYKHFSGLDPVKINSQAIISQLLTSKVAKNILNKLPDKITQKLPAQINQKESGGQTNKEAVENTPNPNNANLAFKFLLLADSHNTSDNLNKALNQAKQDYPDLKFIIGLGDYTEVGTIDELKEAKKVFDSFSLRYFLIPGDHDLWDCRNRNLPATSCFTQVFGPVYQSFEFGNFEFLLLNNSDNYTGFEPEQRDWITNELEKTKQKDIKGLFVFIHEPLFHPSSEHVMGWVEKKLKAQAEMLTFELKEAKTSKVFAGDIHYFSQYEEPKTHLPMVTIGAVTSDRNPQTPRFAVVSVYDDGSTKIEDVEIK